MHEEKGKFSMPEIKKPLLEEQTLAGQGSNKGHVNAVKHGERIARLSDLKKRSRQMASYVLDVARTPDETTLGSNLASCSTWLVFNHYYTVDQVRLSKAKTCKKHLLCPVCAKIRGVKQAVKYMERLDEILKENPHLVPAMLTLTVKNGDDIEERFSHLVKSWRTYQNRRRDSLKKGRGFNELSKVDGAVFSYEFTKSDKGWHPHIHAVVLLNSKIDHIQLSKEWHSITGDSFIVDIRKLKPSKTQDIADAFMEVFKYALKFSDMDLGDNWEAYINLRGKRLQGAFGSFWGVVVPDKMVDDLLDNLPFLELFYKYIRGTGYNLEKTLKHDPPPNDDEEEVRRGGGSGVDLSEK